MMESLIHTTLYSDIEVPIIAIIEKRITIPLNGVTIELRKGLRRELPMRFAIPLLKKNMIKIDVSRLYSKGLINKIRWKEERMESLQELDEDFYLKVRILIKTLEEQLKENPDDIELLSTIRQIKISVIDIIKARMQKIVKIASTNPEISREYLKNMTKEERMLYVELCDMLSFWHDSLQKFIDMGEIID